jgi:hypothetical protein
MSSAGWWHGAIAAAVCEFLRAHVRQHRLGLVFAAETGFLLARNPGHRALAGRRVRAQASGC